MASTLTLITCIRIGSTRRPTAGAISLLLNYCQVRRTTAEEQFWRYTHAPWIRLGAAAIWLAAPAALSADPLFSAALFTAQPPSRMSLCVRIALRLAAAAWFSPHLCAQALPAIQPSGVEPSHLRGPLPVRNISPSCKPILRVNAEPGRRRDSNTSPPRQRLFSVANRHVLQRAGGSMPLTTSRCHRVLQAALVLSSNVVEASHC